MKFLAAAGLAGACLAASPVFAADLFDSAPPPMDAPLQQQSELGANWYIRGDIGYGANKQATVVPSAGLFPTVGNAPIGDASNNVTIQRGNPQMNMGPNFSLGVGYRVNDWFRAEATWTYTPGPGLSTQKTVFCPETTSAVSNYTYNAQNPNGIATPAGYQYDYTQCDGRLNVRQYNNTALAMGYFDIGHWGMFSPFIGVGAGMNVNTMTGSLNFHQQDTGAVYGGVVPVNGSAPAIWMDPNLGVDQLGKPIYGPITRPAVQSGTNQPIGPANWTRKIDTTKYTIAASAAVGVGIQISQSATLDVGYHITTLDLFGGTKSLLQSVNLGVRYNLN
jgi:opacity protein-like surface antigen